MHNNFARVNKHKLLIEDSLHDVIMDWYSYKKRNNLYARISQSLSIYLHTVYIQKCENILKGFSVFLASSDCGHIS